MLPQKQITEAINDAKIKVAKKYGYKIWEDAYKFNGGNSFREMLDEVMTELYNYATENKVSRSDEKKRMVETLVKIGHDRQSAEEYANNKFDWDKAEKLKAEFESKK